MKSIALYWSETDAMGACRVGTLSGVHGYVRMEVIEGTPEEALSKCFPRQGEIVLNTVPAPARYQDSTTPACDLPHTLPHTLPYTPHLPPYTPVELSQLSRDRTAPATIDTARFSASEARHVYVGADGRMHCRECGAIVQWESVPREEPFFRSGTRDFVTTGGDE